MDKTLINILILLQLAMNVILALWIRNTSKGLINHMNTTKEWLSHINEKVNFVGNNLGDLIKEVQELEQKG